MIALSRNDCVESCAGRKAAMILTARSDRATVPVCKVCLLAVCDLDDRPARSVLGNNRLEPPSINTTRVGFDGGRRQDVHLLAN